jgi:hypothetical protein
MAAIQNKQDAALRLVNKMLLSEFTKRMHNCASIQAIVKLASHQSILILKVTLRH